MDRPSRFSRAVAVLAAFGLLMLQNPSAVLATHTTVCQESTAVNRFEGRQRVQGGIAGVQANIEGNHPDICGANNTGDGDAANLIWVGIDANDNHGLSIIQAGTGNCSDPTNASCNGGTGIQWWAWGRSPASSNCGALSQVSPTPRKLASLVNTTVAYEVVRTSSQWQVWINGTVEATLPLSTICWPKNRGLWTGESWDRGDAIGGFSTDHILMSSAIYEASVGGAWASPGFPTGSVCNIAPTLSIYHCTTTSNSVSIWTVH